MQGRERDSFDELLVALPGQGGGASEAGALGEVAVAVYVDDVRDAVFGQADIAAGVVADIKESEGAADDLFDASLDGGMQRADGDRGDGVVFGGADDPLGVFVDDVREVAGQARKVDLLQREELRRRVAY